jgi:hypothetical protein
MDLHGQLAGRGQHQGTHLAGLALRVGGMGQQVGEQGHQEGRGLAGAGLGLARQVAPLEGDGQGQRLYRRTGRKTCIFNTLHQLCGQLEVLEPDVAQMIF